MKSMITERQSTEARRYFRQRGDIKRANTTAPEITLAAVKLAASMSSWPRASRQSREFAANAIIAATVSQTIFEVAELEVLEGTLAIVSYANRPSVFNSVRLLIWRSQILIQPVQCLTDNNRSRHKMTGGVIDMFLVSFLCSQKLKKRFG